jgi:cytochrome P450
MPDVHWDPFDPELNDHPYPVWRRLRDTAPVYHHRDLGFYALSRFADVKAALADHRHFSSTHGRALEAMSATPLQSRSLVFQDPPRHTALRRLAGAPFALRGVGRYEERIRRRCAELLDAQVGSGGFDYADEFGSVLPAVVVWDLLGVDDDARPELRRLIWELVDDFDAGVGVVHDGGFKARIELSRYWQAEVRRRRAEPGDDLVSGMIDTAVHTGGERRTMTVDEIVDFTSLLVTAGSDTSALFLGWAALVLAEQPDQRRILVDHPGTIPNAVEELLRFEAPSHAQGRVVRQPVEVHGTTLPAGAKVLLLTGSAGRDERQYHEPDRFDVRRRFDGHMALGHGVHFCIGAALARLQLRVALEETLRRFPRWEVDRESAVRLQTSTMRGWSKLPIVLEAA